MPVVNYPQNPQKAVASDVTLDKAELAAKPAVSQDPYFSNQDNWGKIIVFMRSAVGNQKIQYIFNASEAVPAAQFIASDKARDDFEVVKLVINDFDGGSLTINRDQLEAQDFDFSFVLNAILDFTFLEVVSDDDKFSNGIVNAIATDSQNNVYVGGSFTDYNQEVGRNYLLKFNSQGQIDTTFMSNAVDGGQFNDQVTNIALDSQGNVYIAGRFISYDGITGRDRFLKFDSSGILDTAYVANASDNQKFTSAIQDMAIDSQDKIYAGGDFLDYGGVTDRNRLIKLNLDGTVDTTFATNAIDGNKFGSVILGIALDNSDNVYLGGAFSNIGGVTDRDFFVKLDSSGNIDNTFTNNAAASNKFTSAVSAVALDSQGNVFVAGSFTNYDSVQGRGRFIKLDNSGLIDAAFVGNSTDADKIPNTSTISTMIVNSVDEVYLAGIIQNYDGDTQIQALLKFQTNGNLDNVFIDNIVRNKLDFANVQALEESPAKSFYFGGFIQDYIVQDRNNFIKVG